MTDKSIDNAVTNLREVPEVVARALARIPDLYAQKRAFDVQEFRRELNELSWRGSTSGSVDAPEQSRLCSTLLTWAVYELTDSTFIPPHGLYRIQVVLTTLLMAADSDNDVLELVPETSFSPRLLDALQMLLSATKFDVLRRRDYLGDDQWYESSITAGRECDFRSLGNAIRHLNIELTPDVHAAVMFLYRYAPEKLALQLEERKDVFFSVSVHQALREVPPRFALSVSDITFKFICASAFGDTVSTGAPDGVSDVVIDLLFQVAKTDHWRAWLLDFARYPKTDTIAVKALSQTLVDLTPTHWSAFIDAVELWTYAGTAGPVAEILVPFLHKLGNEKSSEMWRFAFKRWDEWDYGSSEDVKHMSAPSICSFDFPVAMHYAFLPAGETEAVEAGLLHSIATIEQKWFSDLSQLVTFRNRLSSRLRLVQHGIAIRTPPPGGANPLPPDIEPDSQYAEFRYRYHDVNSMKRRRNS